MTNYKSLRLIDGKPRWAIVDERGEIVNRNPSKEELKNLEEIYFGPRTIYYNRTNTCGRCEISFDKATGHPMREYDKERNWTGRWDCNNCYEKYDPNSHHNTIKSLTYRRIGNLDPNSSQAKGDNFEELTCIWRSTVSTIRVENLNKKLDNYRCPIDHSIDSELGIIQTKGRLYDPYDRLWGFCCIESEWYKEFDYMICYCADKSGKYIERIYIFPISEITVRKSITIHKNPTKGNRYGTTTSISTSWYDKYRITDEETIKKVNEIWNEIKNK